MVDKHIGLLLFFLMADLSLPLLFQLLQSPGQVPVGLVEGFHRVKQLVARLPLELGGHIAQLFGVVNVVLQHILEHGDCLNAAVVVVVVAAVGMLVRVGIGLSVLAGMGVLVGVAPVALVAVVVMAEVSHIPFASRHIDIILTRYTIPQIFPVCKE